MGFWWQPIAAITDPSLGNIETRNFEILKSWGNTLGGIIPKKIIGENDAEPSMDLSEETSLLLTMA